MKFRPKLPRVALVTGAREGGISFAVAERLLLDGCEVVMGDRDKKAGIAAAQELRRRGLKKVSFFETDFSDELQVGSLMDRIERQFGRLDILINTSGSAGNPLEDNLPDLTPANFTRLFHDNVLTFFNATRAAVTRFMQHQKTGGVVVAFSTNNGILGVRGQFAYGGLKQTLTSFCASLTVAYASRGIRFLVVSPGVVLTDSENWRRRRGLNPAWPLVEGGLNPTRRMVTAEDVAAVVVDICGERWQMVTGVEIVVDGGERAAGGDLFPRLDLNDYRRSAVDLSQALETAEARPQAA